MEIVVDPANPKNIKLVKHPRNLLLVAGLILAAGVVLSILINNFLAFLPFLLVVGLFYAFSGNYFEISVDFKAREIYRKSHDMLHLTNFYSAVKIDDIQKIWLIPNSNTSCDLVIVQKDKVRKKLCSATYGPDREELRKFSFVLSDLVDRPYSTDPDKGQ